MCLMGLAQAESLLPMAYDPKRHNRKSIRLKGYDYRSPGAYFVTICVKHHRHSFGKVQAGEMQLNQLGEIAADRWSVIPDLHPDTKLDAYVIMPNHMHGIIIIENNPGKRISGAPDAFGKPAAGSLATIVRTYKAAVSRLANRAGLSFRWQKGYYEQIIRSERALSVIRRYILNNPAKWHRDRLRR